MFTTTSATTRGQIAAICDELHADDSSQIDELIDQLLERLGDSHPIWQDPALWTRALDYAAHLLHRRGVDLSPLCESHETTAGAIGDVTWCDGTCHARPWAGA